MPDKRWFWATLTLSSVTIVSVVFAVMELAVNHFFRDADYVTLHYLYITRGIVSSLLLAFWAAWFVLRQRRRSEEDLRRSRERYRGLMEAIPGAVVLYDRALRVTEWNVGAERMYGYGVDEIRGSELPIIPEAKKAELAEFMQRVDQGETVLDVETLRLPRRGEPFEVQLSLLPFCEPGAPAYYLEVASDIRERVRLRERMLEIEKLTSMGKMAAGTAHHLNSPLAALLIRAQLMRRRACDQAAVEDVERIEEGLNFCRHFVQRLLDFTRAAPARTGPQDLGAVLESVCSFFRPAIQAKGVRLTVDAADASGRLLRGDRNLLETLLLTLLSNALDATPAGGEIRVKARLPAPDSVGFEVRDSGSGIPAEHLQRVFEPFFTTKEPGKGTGLGLAIARNVVLEHGGTIRIESRPGEGTAVSVDFPTVEAVQPAEKVAS